MVFKVSKTVAPPDLFAQRNDLDPEENYWKNLFVYENFCFICFETVFLKVLGLMGT
jgi:hypothetical protein